MQTEQFCKKIYIYRDVFKDVEKTINYFNSSEYWEPWSNTGTMININHSDDSFVSAEFPSYNDWNSWVDSALDPRGQKLGEYEKEIYDVFYKVSKSYMEINNLSLPEWHTNTLAVCRHEPKMGYSKELAMPYHHDYDRNHPDVKYFVTINMYMNDDYSGGEISYRAFDWGDEGFEEVKLSPKAGDVVVFPSRYEHSVSSVQGGKKVFARATWDSDMNRVGKIGLKESYEII